MTAPVVGGFPAGVVLEVSVLNETPEGRPKALTLAELQELVERCAFLGIPHSTVVIFGASRAAARHGALPCHAGRGAGADPARDGVRLRRGDGP